MKKIQSSFSSNGVSLVLEGPNIVVEKMPTNHLFDDCLFEIINEDGKTIWHQKYKRGKRMGFLNLFKSDKLNIGKVDGGNYYLCIWCKSNSNYSLMIGQCEIQIRIADDNVEFLSPISCPSNRHLLETLDHNDPRLLSPSELIQSKNINIRDTANQIKRDSTERDVPLLHAVHEWVALNISYDRDALIDDIYQRKNNSSLSTLSKRKGVCQGYTNLTVALLRTLSIPSVGISCCATNIIAKKKKGMMDGESNHIFPIAWNGNRWVLMDPTWDSRNTFVDGDFSYTHGPNPTSTPCFPFKYFDNTLDFFSSTHKFTMICY